MCDDLWTDTESALSGCTALEVFELVKCWDNCWGFSMGNNNIAAETQCPANHKTSRYYGTQEVSRDSYCNHLLCLVVCLAIYVAEAHTVCCPALFIYMDFFACCSIKSLLTKAYFISHTVRFVHVVEILNQYITLGHSMYCNRYGIRVGEGGRK